MRASLKIDEKQVSGMDLQISITMKFSEWRDMRRQLPNEWPSWQISALIASALGHVSKAVNETIEVGE